MNPRVHLERLTKAEAERVRATIEEHGAKQAARLLGLHWEGTVRKVATGEPAQSLTIAVVRSRLSTI